tara:strand:+ start:215 stop:559 length:345 start_codon:yes stop_codon:yes gene_type:complete
MLELFNWIKKLTTQLRYVFCLVALYNFLSCKQGIDDSLSDIQIGIVLGLGNPALDGCGLVIQVDGGKLRALEIDSSYLVDSLLVRIQFDKLQSISVCGLGTPISEININKISRF